MRYVKRSLGIIGVASAFCFIPVTSQAVSPSATPAPVLSTSAIPAPTPGTAANSHKRATHEAAKVAYRAELTLAQNGRDLAFADANATMMQALSTAGKDTAARKAAHDAYKSAAKEIIAVYKQAVTTAIKDYKTAIAASKGK